VGPTGGGKTTLVSLISRFYEPTSGRVLLDGVDYRNRSLRWLQSKLGIVLQTAHVFSGTIMENIRYGRLDATDEEVKEAAKLTGAEDFILSMPDAYESEVGESGNRLSSGQKQLLSYARAVLADPLILILDEATSSVDTETEQKIQKSMESLVKGRFSFVIAHRLSTIQKADKIFFIKQGRVVEEGTHSELLALNGEYAALQFNQHFVVDQSVGSEGS
ncbi:MAG: ATP-binding cassette domain-containing protein, partial [Gammaproteobacteria bacterium]|nr:ATP-binding cassette domain-containing protein [Gammaproteobacteria bacterium]